MIDATNNCRAELFLSELGGLVLFREHPIALEGGATRAGSGQGPKFKRTSWACPGWANVEGLLVGQNREQAVSGPDKTRPVPCSSM